MENLDVLIAAPVFAWQLLINGVLVGAISRSRPMAWRWYGA